jgi:hypothetical protein
VEEAGDLLAGLEQHEDAVRPLAALYLARLFALAALACGKLCVMTGADDARSCLHDALQYFAQAQLPVDAARTQLELAKALASTTPAAAIAHANAALESQCSSWSAAASATPKSASGCSSARRPSSTTSAGSSPSLDCPAEPEPSPTRSRPRTGTSGQK